MKLFWLVWTLWLLSEILLNRSMRSGVKDRKGKDKGSLRLIWFVIFLAIALGVLSSIVVRWPIGEGWQVPIGGLALILIGMAIRFYAIASLGRFFTVDVTIREGHVIKKDGIYRIIRHPSYLGSLISFLGLGVSLNNWLSLAVIVVLITLSFVRRIHVEEQALVDQFGEDYQAYKRHTYRLIPWVY
ncbi:MAG: isoprenylcysteine carboxylmethyltransferase family protein [Marinilabiliales bacterium]|nr:isoprenylcysteine carboxylmethyltransferase family protein [Marinilabiliales bacterium]